MFAMHQPTPYDASVDLEPYLATLRRRDDALRADGVQRAEAARARLPEVVRILVDEFGVQRVVLFGSLRRGTLHERSDIDLAVKGLAADAYWRALDRATRAAERPVDLIPLEEASPSLRARIDADGEVLHG